MNEQTLHIYLYLTRKIFVNTISLFLGLPIISILLSISIIHDNKFLLFFLFFCLLIWGFLQSRSIRKSQKLCKTLLETKKEEILVKMNKLSEWSIITLWSVIFLLVHFVFVFLLYLEYRNLKTLEGSLEKDLDNHYKETLRNEKFRNRD